jgi:F0F1-type ATP synthase assembly protein I
MVANFLLTPLATLATLTGPFTQIGMDLGLSANVVAYSLIYGADQYLFPYEYAVLLYFYSSGYMRLRQIMLIMGLRAVLTLVFLVTVAVPYWQLLGIF